MTSIPRNKVKALARLLNDNGRIGANARLADWTGASPATVKGWQAEEDAEHYRSMSATAKRLLATLAYMHAEGILDDTAMKKIKRIEAHMEAGRGRLAKYLARMTGKESGSYDPD